MNKQTFILWPDPDKRKRIWGNFIEFMRTQPKDKAIRITIQDYTKNRSLAQNAYYWGVVLPAIQTHIEENDGRIWSCDDLHEWFRDEFLPPRVIEVMGKPKIIRPSTADLKVGPFAEYLDRIIRHASIEMGCIVPAPDEDVMPAKFRRAG